MFHHNQKCVQVIYKLKLLYVELSRQQRLRKARGAFVTSNLDLGERVRVKTGRKNCRWFI